MDVTVWRDRDLANSSRDDSIVHIAVAGSDACVRLVGGFGVRDSVSAILIPAKLLKQNIQTAVTRQISSRKPPKKLHCLS